MASKLRPLISKVPFTSKPVILRELGRSHVVIMVSSLIILFLLLNSTYGYADLSIASGRPLMIAASMLVALVSILSAGIAIRAYGAIKNK